MMPGMNRVKLMILWALAVLLVVLMAGKYVLSVENAKLAREMMAAQATITSAQRAEPMLRQMAGRLAQLATREPELADLLRQYNVHITPQEPNLPRP